MEKFNELFSKMDTLSDKKDLLKTLKGTNNKVVKANNNDNI